MNNMKTAKEMYEITRPAAEVKRNEAETELRTEVDRLLKIARIMFEKAASEGQYCVECELHSEYAGAVDIEVAGTLRNLGYKVTFRYDDAGGRFTQISWYAGPAPASRWQRVKQWFWSWCSMEPK